MKRDWNNLFTAEDFEVSASLKLAGIKHYSSRDYAVLANAILREEIAKAPEVYGIEAYGEYYSKETMENLDVGPQRPGGCHCKARLIAIEEINAE